MWWMWGWVPETPVSKIPTRTFAPVAPDAHNAGAPMASATEGGASRRREAAGDCSAKEKGVVRL